MDERGIYEFYEWPNPHSPCPVAPRNWEVDTVGMIHTCAGIMCSMFQPMIPGGACIMPISTWRNLSHVTLSCVYSLVMETV